MEETQKLDLQIAALIFAGMHIGKFKEYLRYECLDLDKLATKQNLGCLAFDLRTTKNSIDDQACRHFNIEEFK